MVKEMDISMDRLDIKLWNLASKGQIVPDRSLLKTPEQIAEIRKSADLNTAVLDHVAAHHQSRHVNCRD